MSRLVGGDRKEEWCYAWEKPYPQILSSDFPSALRSRFYKTSSLFYLDMPTTRFEPSSIKNKFKREEIARKLKRSKRQAKLERRLAQAKAEADNPAAKKVSAFFLHMRSRPLMHFL